MIEHVSLRCRDVEASAAFYEQVLAPLGYEVTQRSPEAVGFMAEGHTSFWVTSGEIATPTHIAFRARSRSAVDRFHRAALEAGGKDHGAPGLRKDYSPTYYAAFVLDRDGHNIEAVTFAKSSRRSTRAKAKRPARRR
jgi:catechol 2,3-dioxygenase-like lactoylglutathione lyase family enzyme